MRDKENQFRNTNSSAADGSSPQEGAPKGGPEKGFPACAVLWLKETTFPGHKVGGRHTYICLPIKA